MSAGSRRRRPERGRPARRRSAPSGSPPAARERQTWPASAPPPARPRSGRPAAPNPTGRSPGGPPRAAAARCSGSAFLDEGRDAPEGPEDPRLRPGAARGRDRRGTPAGPARLSRSSSSAETSSRWKAPCRHRAGEGHLFVGAQGAPRGLQGALEDPPPRRRSTRKRRPRAACARPDPGPGGGTRPAPAPAAANQRLHQLVPVRSGPISASTSSARCRNRARPSSAESGARRSRRSSRTPRGRRRS